MQIIQSRRDFLASPVRGGCGKRPWRPAVTRRRAAAGDHHDPPGLFRPELRVRHATDDRGRGVAARGRVHRRSLRDVAATAEHIDSDRAAANSISIPRDAPWLVHQLDAGEPITVLGGNACRVLRALRARADPDHQRPEGQESWYPTITARACTCTSTIMAAQVGLDPTSDIEWVTNPRHALLDQFVAGISMPFSATPPEPQELRARKIGRAILNTAMDQPWWHYFCCMFYGTRTFVRVIRLPRTLPTGGPQGRRHLRQPSRRWRRGGWSMPGSRGLRLRAPDAD